MGPEDKFDTDDDENTEEGAPNMLINALLEQADQVPYDKTPELITEADIEKHRLDKIRLQDRRSS